MVTFSMARPTHSVVVTSLSTLDKFMLQTHVNRLAGEKSADRVKHACYYMKAIFEEAIDHGLLDKNPARSWLFRRN